MICEFKLFYKFSACICFVKIENINKRPNLRLNVLDASGNRALSVTMFKNFHVTWLDPSPSEASLAHSKP